MRHLIRRILLGSLVLVAASRLYAQTPTLTTEWIAGPGNKVDDVPSFVWLQDGTAILDDRRLPESQPTFDHGYLMLMYGTYDDNVHPQNEEAFMNALIAAGKPYQVELFPMRKHGFVDIPALLQRYNAMLAFWEKNL